MAKALVITGGPGAATTIVNSILRIVAAKHRKCTAWEHAPGLHILVIPASTTSFATYTI